MNEPDSLDPSAVMAAFQANEITLTDLVGRLDELSKDAVKATKDGGVVEDSATRLRATEDLIDLLQVKLGMKARAVKRARDLKGSLGLEGAARKAIEAEVVIEKKVD